MRGKEFFIKHKEIVQLIYGIILIALIPFLIFLNSRYIISQYNEIIETSIQRQGLAIGRALSFFVVSNLNNPQILEENIKKAVESNQHLLSLDVLLPRSNGEEFVIVASYNKERIGKVFNHRLYKTAWQQPIGDGIAVNFLNLYTTDLEPVDSFRAEDSVWLIAMPLADKDGKKAAILSFKISSAIIDEATLSARNSSLLFLGVTIAVVVVFLLFFIKIWDYALLYRKIKEVDQMKDEFISIASHELRTPLTAIKGYIALFNDGLYGKVTKKVKEGLNDIFLSVKRLDELVEDLLNVSRIEQGRLLIEMKPTEIVPVIEEVVKQLTPAAAKKNLALIFKKPSGRIPLVMVDPGRLKQVLVNLVGNSIKYTEKGKVEILTELKEKTIDIIVSDTGIGMSKEEQEHLFEKFYRVKNEKTAQIVGTGLGLWITKQIVELMGGKIMVESMKGVGTRVTVTLSSVITEDERTK